LECVYGAVLRTLSEHCNVINFNPLLIMLTENIIRTTFLKFPYDIIIC